MIEQHGVNVMFTAPTAFRALRKEDPTAKFLQKYDVSSMKALYLAGERSDPDTVQWIKQVVPIRCTWPRRCSIDGAVLAIVSPAPPHATFSAAPVGGMLPFCLVTLCCLVHRPPPPRSLGGCVKQGY